MKNRMQNIQIIFIDLFCGAGGVSTGIESARVNGEKIAKVVVCVNHDPLAIASHKANHSDVFHFIEDVWLVNFDQLSDLIRTVREKYPNALLALWASFECTNYSKAKGGLPKNADSRTLPEVIYKYIEHLNPDIIFGENVEEFMSWGALDDKGKPISRDKGIDYIKWYQKIKSYGYDYDYRILNCADFGAFTSRKRYFAQFVKYGLPIVWPEPTHSKNAKSDIFGSFKQWKAVKDVLYLNNEGESIFTRKKPLCDKTLERILAGLIKFVAKGEKTFLTKYFSGDPDSKNYSINGPAHTIKPIDNHAIVNTLFLAKYYGNGNNIQSIEEPAGTISTKDRFSVVNAQWLDKQYGSGKDNHQSINTPAGAITKNPKLNLVSAKWILNPNFNNVGNDLNEPSPPIMACRKHYYLVDTQFGNTGTSIENPCPTIIARQDKKPLYIISAETGNIDIIIYETDSPAMIKIKQFMAAYGIIDIKMRMLFVDELKLITGFSKDYILKGPISEQKKFIGNAVPVIMAQKLIEAYSKSLIEGKMEVA